MTVLQKSLIGGAAVVVLGAIVATSLLSRQQAKGEEVYMAKAEKKDVISAVTASGRIQPRMKVNVQSQVMGEIVTLPVKEGDPVKKGDLLVQLKPDQYKSEVDRLEANLRMGRIALEQQNVSLENGRRTLSRNRSLYADKLISPEVLEKNELDVKTGEINLKSLNEQISQAEASLSTARDELRKTTIISPIDGIVTLLNAELGEMTLTGTMNNPGTVIMVVSDMGEVLAEVDVDETRVVQVRPGQPARVTVDAVGETHPYDGKVTEIGGTATKRTGQEVLVFPVKVALNQPDPSLRPGMTAKARIETKRVERAVTVPIQSVLLRPAADVEKILVQRAKAGKGGAKDDAKGPKVAEAAGGAKAAVTDPKVGGPAPVPSKPGLAGSDQREVVLKVVNVKAVLVPVKTGISDETSVVILDGIAEGDTVVTGPYREVKKLKDGDAVKESTSKAKESGVEITVE
ncbi:MAG: efflux RND transporter periplasmic adaptor subunit [Acidobacteriia bacterium]|nr:efflux RND transporter periplasmic adaptor subunit [Terriglobia bacterium]